MRLSVCFFTQTLEAKAGNNFPLVPAIAPVANTIPRGAWRTSLDCKSSGLETEVNDTEAVAISSLIMAISIADASFRLLSRSRSGIQSSTISPRNPSFASLNCDPLFRSPAFSSRTTEPTALNKYTRRCRFADHLSPSSEENSFTTNAGFCLPIFTKDSDAHTRTPLSSSQTVCNSFLVAPLVVCMRANL